MMHTGMFWAMGLGVLLLPVLAWGELVVCGTATGGLANTGELRAYFFMDPSKVTGAGYADCTVLPAANHDETAAQKALIETHQRAGTIAYLKVVGGRVVEKSPGDKASVDAARQSQRDREQILAQELAQPGVCLFTEMADINAKLAERRATKQGVLDTQRTTLQGQIDGLATLNLTNVRAILTQMNTAKYQADTDLLEEAYALGRGIIRCEFARRGGRP